MFSASVKARRESRNWTQTDLARAMKERGFSFHQQTVQRIEDGARPVRLEEAYELAEVLDSRVDDMSRSYEGIRRHELQKLRLGALDMPSGFFDGWERWCKEASMFCGHVGHLLDEGQQTDRALVGLALLERMVKWRDKLFDLEKRINEEWIDGEFRSEIGADGDDGDPSVNEYEQRILDLLKDRKAPPRFRKLTVPELAAIYYSGEETNGQY